MRILLVDDESLIRMDMRDLVESLGHEVVGEGKNGVEAINLAKSLQPDVVLMDVKMPELDGIEAARQIRFDRLAPVVLLTAYSQQDLVERAQESGVYGYLIKPVREVEVLPALMMARARFDEENEIHQAMKDTETALEERKLVPKATAELMRVHGFSEDTAYEKIRSYSMNKQLTIVETCKRIISSYKNK